LIFLQKLHLENRDFLINMKKTFFFFQKQNLYYGHPSGE